MARNFNNWLTAFLDYSSYAESPKEMRFWAGVSAIAGALRRKVWIDQRYFTWTPNFFIILVAPPGIVSKSTTADLAMNLLREVPGIKFGPDVVTWPALVQALAGSCESFEYQEEWHPMSPLTLVASELGNLIQPQDRELINMYIHLWDGKKTVEKVTKTSGSDVVEAPWVNMIGCTTPHWIADNMPPATVGGGFTSRCIFVYAEAKEKFVAYPRYHIPKDFEDTKMKLIQDLEHISTNLVGEYVLTQEAIRWGEAWYRELWTNRPLELMNEKLDGYVARKQTHLHKLAMVLAASESDSMTIDAGHLQHAEMMLKSVEVDMELVFSRIGKSEASLQLDNLLEYMRLRGSIPMEEASRYIHSHFPDYKDMDGVLSGLIRSGYCNMEMKGNVMMLTWLDVTGKVTAPKPGN